MSRGAALPTVRLASPEGQIITIQFSDDKEVGRGSFGVVFSAVILETGERVAIKRVLQDDRYINRELAVMKAVFHPNIVTLKRYWEEPAQGGIQLSLVMEYVPETVGKIIKYYDHKKLIVPPIVTKLYVYQMCRGLAYLHAGGICHRDIKPHNLLCDSKSHVLKVCDFGSAKELTGGKPSIAYICSRYYRAPELIFGATEYGFAIDVWSAGCVFAEMMLCTPIFAGETSVDQKMEIIKILGSPSREQLLAMNPDHAEGDMPEVRRVPWSSIFKARASPEAIDLLDRMLSYDPAKRITALQVLTHPFFDELRSPAARLPNGDDLPPLFNISRDELKYMPMEVLECIVPTHARTAANWPGPVSSLVPRPSYGSTEHLDTDPARATSSSAVVAAAIPRSTEPTASKPPTATATPATKPANPGIASRTFGLLSSLTTRSIGSSSRNATSPTRKSSSRHGTTPGPSSSALPAVVTPSHSGMKSGTAGTTSSVRKVPAFGGK